MTNALPQVHAVDFHGSRLATLEHNGEPYVAMRPIVEAIGLGWGAQFERIKHDPVLSGRVSTIETHDSMGRRQEMTCLPLKLLNGWLFKIDSRRVREDIRDRVVAYQTECYDVLSAYWSKGIAVRSDTEGVVTELSPKAMRALGGMFKGIVHKEIDTIVGEMIDSRLREDPRAAVRDMVSSRELLDEQKVPSKGRRPLILKTSHRLRRYSETRGHAVRRTLYTGTLVFERKAVEAWMNTEGKALILEHMEALSKQGAFKLFAKRENEVRRKSDEEDGEGPSVH